MHFFAIPGAHTHTHTKNGNPSNVSCVPATKYYRMLYTTSSGRFSAAKRTIFVCGCGKQTQNVYIVSLVLDKYEIFGGKAEQNKHHRWECSGKMCIMPLYTVSHVIYKSVWSGRGTSRIWFLVSQVNPRGKWNYSNVFFGGHSFRQSLLLTEYSVAQCCRCCWRPATNANFIKRS